jgi:hypothetical protein
VFRDVAGLQIDPNVGRLGGERLHQRVNEDERDVVGGQHSERLLAASWVEVRVGGEDVLELAEELAHADRQRLGERSWAHRPPGLDEQFVVEQQA